MGERKGVNKYYPPDFDYKKHGSLDKYHNSHPLRERARKLSQGILIIRFEMPYNIWCNGCNQHIGMGVRYNAEKKKVGKYYSTIIYKFRMKCHLCDQYFEIQTDPANCEYKILSGARRKEERWNAKDNEQIEATDHEVKKKLISDPMFKLEHARNDETKSKEAAPNLQQLHGSQMLWKDDYQLHKLMRKNFKYETKRIEEKRRSDEKILLNGSIKLELLDETEEDVRLAKLYKYLPLASSSAKGGEASSSSSSAIRKAMQRPIFDTDRTKPTSAKMQVAQLLGRKRPAHHHQQQQVKMKPVAKRRMLGIHLPGDGKKKPDSTAQKTTTSLPNSLVADYSASSSSDND